MTSVKIAWLAALAMTALAGAPAALAQLSSASSASTAPALDYNAIKARYTHAHWTYPGSEQMADAYPREAQDSRIQGAAQIACFIKPDGYISRCVVMAEAPKGYNFGLATAGAFQKYAHVDPASVDGGIQAGDFYVFVFKWMLS